MSSDHVDDLTRQWARERPELDLDVVAITARVLRLQRFFDQAVQRAIAHTGLTKGELNVLAALRRAGAPFELTPTELYRGLLVSSGAMTNRLDRLEEAGLVDRTPDQDDRRRIRVSLTERGRELIDEAMDAHNATLGATLACLDEHERAQLEHLLRRILSELEREHHE